MSSRTERVARDAHRIWCAISGHGYGHLSQLAPVIHLLHATYPMAKIHVVADLPAAIVRERLPMAETIERRSLDVGLVQSDPFFPDLAATTRAIDAMHRDWARVISREADRMRTFSPDLVIGDVPYLAFAAAQRIGVPAVAVASLTWDAVLAAYFPIEEPPFAQWHEEMCEAYANATCALHPAPALPEFPFATSRYIEPIHQAAQRRRETVRRRLGVDDSDNRPLVLVTTGGLRSELPLTRLRRMADCLWLLAGNEQADADNVRSTSALAGFSFPDIVASVDIVLAKVGYNTAVEAVAAGVPIVYVRRGRFPDEAPIVDWMNRMGVARELPIDDFLDGNWQDSVMAMVGQRTPTRQFTGARQAALAMGRFL